MHESVYPNLCKMARDYLVVSGTGVPVERCFSAGSNLLSDPKRNRLHGDTIKKCMCLKAWFKMKDQEAVKKLICEFILAKSLGN